MTGPCAVHSDRPAKGTCAICGAAVCDLCARPRGQEMRCPTCAEVGVPWEHAGNRVLAYFVTLRDCLLQPRRAFRGLVTARGLRNPFTYDVITQYIATSVPTFMMSSFLTTLPLKQLVDTLFPGAGYTTILGHTPAELGRLVLWSFPFAGLWMAGLDFAMAALMHGTLLLSGRGIGPFARTYAAAVYGGTPTILNVTVIPTVLFIPQLWAAYSTILALREVHKISNARATAAVVVPYLILALGFMAVIGVVMMGVYHRVMTQFSV